MDKRRVIVVSSATQSQTTFETDAVTLGDLKKELDARNVNYDGMTFLEGHSKCELNLDDAVLPTNIPYKGGITNDLVFLLTTPQKKIKSGSMRIDVYGIIKDHNLAEAIKEYFNKSYTNVSTDGLVEFLRGIGINIAAPCGGNENHTELANEHVTDDDDSDETDVIEAMVDGLKHIVYGMTRLGYINPVEITTPDERHILSDEEMQELFGDFLNR